MASEMEIRFARARKAIEPVLLEVVEGIIAENKLDVVGRAVKLGSYQGPVRGDTVAGQGLQHRWAFHGGAWVEILITGEPPEWNLLILLTSSGTDAAVEMNLDDSDFAARVAIERVFASL